MIRGNAIFKVILLFLVYSADLSILYSVVADPGEGPGEPAPPPPPPWGPGGREFFLVEPPPPPPTSQGVDDRPLPPPPLI